MSVFKPWKVLHLELSRGVPALSAEEQIGGLYLVFWWHDIPLGHAEITVAQLPMPAPHLAELILKAITPAVGAHLFEDGFRARLPVAARMSSSGGPPEFHEIVALKQPLARLQEHLSLSSALDATVSVVVCTRDRPEELECCLRSLRDLVQQPFEILVVDNAPTSDATRRLVTEVPGVRYLLEPRPGLSAARNAGICSSTGDIIAFTDDDVTVHPHWLSRLRQGFESPEVMAVTGLVLPAELETEAQFLFQRGNGGFGWGYRALTFDAQFFARMKPRGVPVWHIGAGANMAFRREAFERAGRFDERLGAGASGCSEDSEMWYRVLAEGWRCRFEPTAVVYHRHRQDLAGLEHQMHQYMRGHMAALLVQFEKYHHWGNLRRAFSILPLYYAKQLVRWALWGDKSESTLRAQIFGCAAGIEYYLQHRRSAAQAQREG